MVYGILIPCKCGCGELIPEINKLGKPARFKLGHNARGYKYQKSQYDNRRGVKHPNFKGGRYVEHGYVLVLKPDHPFANHHGYVLEHRLVMEEYVGRYLTESEIVHHINENKLDNRIENLKIMIRADHNSHHFKGKPLIDRSDWICSECGQMDETKWYHTVGSEVICHICYGWKWRTANS